MKKHKSFSSVMGKQAAILKKPQYFLTTSFNFYFKCFQYWPKQMFSLKFSMFGN